MKLQVELLTSEDVLKRRLEKNFRVTQHFIKQLKRINEELYEIAEDDMRILALLESLNSQKKDVEK